MLPLFPSQVPYGPLCENVTSFTKPEVDIALSSEEDLTVTFNAIS